MEYINLTLENIDNQHICCAISDKKHQTGVDLKKEWLKERIPEGHIFRKLDAQGKVFIEFAPLEYAWTPIIGDNYIYIYCLWVAGSFKDNGYGKELLNYAISFAKENKKGLCTITSKKKKPFLSEKKFFEKNGFKVVDTIGDYELLALTFDNNIPKFSDNARKMQIKNKNLTIYYSPQCPFTNNCIKEIKEYMEENNLKFDFVCVDTLEKAKNVPCIFNSWAIFIDGKYVSNQLLNKNLLQKLLSERNE